MALALFFEMSPGKKYYGQGNPIMPASYVPRAFRHDINVLRAIAVISVLLFHFTVPGFSGGFVGVDVFFVISGFLMTAILVKGLEKLEGRLGAHSIFQLLWKFYLARARRIIPALAVLVATLLIVGWFTLPLMDYELLAKHSVSALGFFSNVMFWLESGYFDSASHEKWLLHTWTLSVEWQFYLLLPLVVVAAWLLKAGRVMAGLVIGAALLASLGYCVWLTNQDPSGAFFLLPGRAWELLAGGLVFLLADRWTLTNAVGTTLQVVGLLAIATSILVFDAGTSWPGMNAILPVAGTMLVLTANHQSTWTKNGVVQWLGLSSYSIYLWHWPVYVALVYTENEHVVGLLVAGLALSLVLGGLSYHLVEKFSIRWLTGLSQVSAPIVIAVGVVAVAVPALAIKKADGVTGRLGDTADIASREETNINPRREACHHNNSTHDFPWCSFGGQNVKAVMVGDSHAASVITALNKAVQAIAGVDAGVYYASHSSCPTIFGTQRAKPGWHCDDFNHFVAEKLKSLPPSVPVVIVNTGSYVGERDGAEGRSTIYFKTPRSQISHADYLNEFTTGLVETACQLAADRKVYLVRPIPHMPENVPRVLARRIVYSGDTIPSIATSLRDYHAEFDVIWRAQDQAAAQCNVAILDSTRFLCDDGECYGSDATQRPYYYDSHHLSEYGNQRLIPMFSEVVGASGQEPYLQDSLERSSMTTQATLGSPSLSQQSN